MNKKIDSPIPVHFHMNDDVHVERVAFQELQDFLKIDNTISKLNNHAGFEEVTSKELEVSISPDFHKGAGIPIGTTIKTENFVIPAAIGNDINCGMRFYKTNLTESEIMDNFDSIEKKIRHVFFEGGRGIPMKGKHREALLKEGLIGLHETISDIKNEGIWKYYDFKQQERDLSHVDKMGSFITDQTIGLESFINSQEITYDANIGSIGGGNHFLEFQRINKIINPAIAKIWGIKEGQIVSMIHTGSLVIGHHSGAYFRTMMQEIYPKGIKKPENGVYLLPNSEKYKNQWKSFWSLLNNAGNFAFANRMMLGLMIYKSISEVVREFDFELLYDSPHNFVWEEMIDGKKSFIHRKGSSTSKSAEQMQATLFETTGQPVMIPGSMGAKSYLLAGLGNRNSLFSSSHGAGRSRSRGDALKVDDRLFREFMERFKVITPVDPKRPDLRGRFDIIGKWEEELKKEAPYAYKDIHPIIETHEQHQMAMAVAEMEPLFTIKG